MKLGMVKQRYCDVPRVIPQDFEDYALSFFFNSYILLSTDPSNQNGYLGCLNLVWMQRPTFPLRSAVTAVAFSLLEAWSGMDPNLQQSLARSHYVQGIAAVRNHLDSGEHINDNVLMATLMLDMYEAITSFCGARSHGALHLEGAKALVESRRRLPLSDEASQRILLGTRSHVIGKAMSKKDSVTEEILSWVADSEDILKTPKFKLEEIDFDLANLQASVSALLADDPSNRNIFAMNLLSRANDIDQRLMAWLTTIPSDWRPSCVSNYVSIPQCIRDAGLYQSHCIVHKTIFIADVLNGYCCSCIRVQLVILSCLEHLNKNNSFLDANRANAYNNIQDMADTVCASVPFFLGDRVRMLRFDDRSVRYPCLGYQMTPAEHYDAAAAYSGIFLSQRLSDLLLPGLELRAGQVPWVLGQMRRIKEIYLASPHTAA